MKIRALACNVLTNQKSVGQRVGKHESKANMINEF